jgi:hypothetical protein
VSHPQPAVLSAVEDHEDWQPHAAEEFQQVGTVGKIAIGLLGASTVTHLLSTWSDWNTYSVVHRYLGGLPGVDDADLNRADAIAKVTAVPNVIVSVAAAVVFVIWLWRARINSEVFCQADHRRSHGWVLASWFCPGPNLWYPKQIVDDVWLASDPKTPVYADDLRRFRTPALTSVWWVTWIGALAFDVVIRRFLMWMEATVGSLRGIALAGTASLVLTAASAAAATLVIRKINTMQTGRAWVPWWDQQPKLTAVPSYEVSQVPSYANDDTDEQPAISEPIAAPALAAVRMERQPELQMAGGAGAPSPFANGGFPGDGAAAGEFPAAGSPFAAPAAFGGDAGLNGGTGLNGGALNGGTGFNGDAGAEEPPKWSPFAPVVQSWQDEESGPKTEQFDAVQSWQEESKPAAEEFAKPSWNEYLGSGNDDLLSTPAPSSWQDETPPLTVLQPEPYSYEPQPAAEPSWASSYSESYSYDSTSDYLTSTAEAATASEPEPAPVARAGRRAARVAVDSPSAIQPAVSSHSVHAPSSHTHESSPVSASSGYYEPAPVVSQADDYLTPSKPLPPVPSYGPEPSYSTSDYSPEPEPTYSSYESSTYEYNSSADDYTSYGSSSDYQASTDYNYSSDYSSSNYETSYDSYSPTSYSGSEYSSQETSYESYSPNYTSESYGDYNNPTPDYYSTPEQPAGEYQQYSYGQPQPAPEQSEQNPNTPRTHPRRRWV